MLQAGEPVHETAKMIGQVAINYGQFSTYVVTFLIVAFRMFMLIKAMNQYEAQAGGRAGTYA